MTNTSFDEFCANLDNKSRHQQLLDIKRSEERKKLNRGFIQVYETTMLMLDEVIDKNKIAARIFCILSAHMPKNNMVSVKRELLAKFLGVSTTTVSAAIKYLINIKLIKAFKEGRSNNYCVNAAAAWTADAISKEYAKFNTHLYLSPELLQKLNALHERWCKVIS